MAILRSPLLLQERGACCWCWPRTGLCEPCALTLAPTLCLPLSVLLLHYFFFFFFPKSSGTLLGYCLGLQVFGTFCAQGLKCHGLDRDLCISRGSPAMCWCWVLCPALPGKEGLSILGVFPFSLRLAKPSFLPCFSKCLPPVQPYPEQRAGESF